MYSKLFYNKLMKNNQKGFSAVEALIILVIVGLIGFAGWFVWQSQKNDDSDQNNTQQTDQNSDEVIAEEKLCYVSQGSLQCYKNSDSKTAETVTPASLAGLDIERVVPSPNDDKLAILANQQDNGEMEMYIASGNDLVLEKVDLKSYAKDTDSLAWTNDQSALVFEAKSAEARRLVVKLTISSGIIEPLSDPGKLAMNPQVVGDLIAYEQNDDETMQGWQWHTMELDGSNDKNLDIDGYTGTSMGENLLVATYEDNLIKVNLANGEREQLPIALEGLNTSGSGSNLTHISENKIAYVYKAEPADGPNDTLALVDLSTKTVNTFNNTHAASWPFSTKLL